MTTAVCPRADGRQAAGFTRQQKSERQLTADVERLQAKIEQLEALLCVVCDRVGVPYERSGDI